jgi:hypothetical protein
MAFTRASSSCADTLALASMRAALATLHVE